MARVKLLKADESQTQSREFLEKVERNGASVLNLYRAVAHSPSVVSNFIKLGNVLLNKTALSPKLRELAILRIATISGSNYELTQHIPIAREVGITEAQIDNITVWQKSDNYNEEERCVLKYTDEVSINVNVKDETFDLLRKYLDEQSIVELTISIGYWGMIARVLVPLQIEIEEKSVSSTENLLGKHK